MKCDPVRLRALEILLEVDEKEEVVMFDSKPFLLRHATDAQPLVKALVQTGCFSRYLTDTAGKPFCTHPTAVGGQ